MGLDFEHDFHIRDVIKNVMALALLPPDQIREAFELIRDAQNPPYVVALAPFFTHMENVWLNTVTPEAFSVYGDRRAITDCSTSSVTIVINKMGTGPFAPWKFISNSLFIVLILNHLY